MKEINELNLPDDLRYTKTHEWAKVEGDKVKVGITDYAQDQIGDVVFVELPQIGDSFDQADEFGTIESVKAVSELFMPLGGEIVAINETLEETPEKVNEDPYNQGWMIDIKPVDLAELDKLMTKDKYIKWLQGGK